jgi:hypothetical protein
MSRTTLLVSAGLSLLAACSREPPTPSVSNASAAAISSSGSPSAVAALDRLDARAPLPLLPMMAQHQKQNMRDHLVAVQQIVAAVARSDFAAVELAARRIGTSESMQRMCTHMGAGAPGFTEQALAFHEHADGIAAAALDQARDRVLAELSTTLTACTACHAAWKQQVVDESTWQRLTGAVPHQQGPHQHHVGQ